MTSVLESLGWGSHEGFTVGARRVGRVVIMHGASAEVIWQEPDGAEGSGLCSLAKGLSRTPVAGDWVVVSDRRITELGAASCAGPIDTVVRPRRWPRTWTWS